MSDERVLLPNGVAGTVIRTGYIARVVGDDECIYYEYETRLRPIPSPPPGAVPTGQEKP